MCSNALNMIFSFCPICHAIDDDALGHLSVKWFGCYESSGVVFITGEPTVSVNILTGIFGALEPARQAFLRLRIGYKEWQPSIANALKYFYESQDIWFRLSLSNIVIDTRRRRREPRITLTYHPDWEKSRKLIVRMENWKPVSAYCV